MRLSFFPSTDLGLLDWAINFARCASQKREALGIPEPLAAELLQKQQHYAACLNLAGNDLTRTKVTISDKNKAAAAFKAVAREVAGRVRSQRDLSDGWLIELGLTVPRRSRQRVAPPERAPFVQVLGTRGHTVRLMIVDTIASRAARPIGTVGASLWGAISDDAPTESAQWTIHTMASRARCTFPFPVGQAPGTRVWIAARWVTRRGETSPLSQPASACLSDTFQLPGAAA